MRVTTLLRRLTGVTQVTQMSQMYVKGSGADRRRPADDDGGAVGAAFPMRRVREAGAAATGGRSVRWRHLSWGRMPAVLRRWRVSCPRCDVKAKRVPWAAGVGAFTSDFEERAVWRPPAAGSSPSSTGLSTPAAIGRCRALRRTSGRRVPGVCSSSCATRRSAPRIGVPSRPSAPRRSPARCAAATAPGGQRTARSKLSPTPARCATATAPRRGTDTQQMTDDVVLTARQRGPDPGALINAMLRASDSSYHEALAPPAAASRSSTFEVGGLVSFGTATAIPFLVTCLAQERT